MLLLVGAAAGAFGAGSVNSVDAWRQRRLNRRVAARLILGDLYVLEAGLELIETKRLWPHRLDLATPVMTWRENRQAFAAAVKAWEWAIVDGVYANLERTVPMARPGEACTENDLAMVSSLRRGVVDDATPIVVEQAIKKRERDEVFKQLTLRRKIARDST